MQAARLHGPEDLRIDDVPEPNEPGVGEALIQVTAVGICGSDLHNYRDARIGSTQISSPIVLGHEFAGQVLTVGEDARDGLDNLLQQGQRVTIDPATPCYHCEFCEQGNPNLCRRLHFHGLWPDDGALKERMIVVARSCFPFPDNLSDAAGALLEPLGVAIHAVDLGKLRMAKSVAVLGCGPIGLLILRLAKLSGADPIYAFDCFPWRVEKAKAWGASDAWVIKDHAPVTTIHEQTAGRGIDVVFEAAWADESVAQSAEIASRGGRVILVGIPSEDEILLRHSVARRKGLTIKMARRMKHTYPRAIQLAANGVDLEDMVSHRFPLHQAAEAFKFNTDYEAGVYKVMIDVSASK